MKTDFHIWDFLKYYCRYMKIWLLVLNNVHSLWKYLHGGSTTPDWWLVWSTAQWGLRAQRTCEAPTSGSIIRQLIEAMRQLNVINDYLPVHYVGNSPLRLWGLARQEEWQAPQVDPHARFLEWIVLRVRSPPRKCVVPVHRHLHLWVPGAEVALVRLNFQAEATLPACRDRDSSPQLGEPLHQML